jgi:capsular exopolysaccharide synthesis family protein
MTLRLKPAAAQFSELRIVVRPFSDAVAKIGGHLSVGRAGKEADIIVLRYEDTDPGLVWKVPNVIAERFIEGRQEAQKLATRSQAKFLRGQIDTLAVQLAASEEVLKRYRERARVVSPAVEESSQITRLVNLESERSSLESERSALAKLLADVEARHKQQASGTSSAYRELLSFPSLLRSEAASRLMGSLSQVEDQRATLLTRRTEADPDVRLLSARVKELEDQLSTIATAYLQGLSNQVSSLDAAIAGFSGELRSMPRKELEFARLERKPLVLKEMYTLLQTRLKEAEIAEAADNSSVSIVDPAIPPRGPFKPKARSIMLFALIGGTLLGTVLAFVRDYADRSIKTRSDATAASGLPVVAIVPHIHRRSLRPAVIARRSAAITGVHEAPALPRGRQPPPGTASYTFLSGADTSTEQPDSDKPVEVGNRRVVPRSTHARMSLSSTAGAVAEAYAILQTNITFSRPDQNIKVLVFTSPLPGEGKTTTAVNLALTLSQRGLSVCLVDADMRRPQVHEVFQLPREPGLSEVLRGLQTFDGAANLVHVGEHQLTVLTAGPQPGSAAGLVGSPRMETLLADLRDRFDLVILDTPPVNILTDAALLGANADGVIVVVRGGSTDAAALQYAMEQLNHVRAPALGVVLNDIDLKAYSAYDRAYKYYSYAAYDEAVPKKR